MIIIIIGNNNTKILCAVHWHSGLSNILP